MKAKGLLLVLLVVLISLFLVSCSNKSDENGYKDITDLYTVTQNDDNTYSYSFSDLNGKILFEKDGVAREPEINQIDVGIYELITQTGTGLSTNWAVYCDVENSKTSDLFYHVLGADENYVICGNIKNNEYLIVVQEIFNNDGEGYFKEYKLENVSPVAADFAVDCKIDNKSAFVTYLTGDDYTEAILQIQLPD
ncbi:MAG: hypothetical protein IKJ88_08250 [Clostridia bacterium]|nr:hypothetical protein [Clostridia bacterium]